MNGDGALLSTLLDCMLTLWMVDSLLLLAVRCWDPAAVPPGDRTQARWFVLHAFANAWITRLTLPGVRYLLLHPLQAFDAGDDPDAASRTPLSIVVALHIYHCLGGFTLSWQDVFHHAVFLPTLGFPGMVYEWGSFGNFLAFFVCGVPGAIDYALLGLHKLRVATGLNQKRICANLNLWVRMPGILFGMGVCFAACHARPPSAPAWAVALQVTFMPFNVLFYTKQSLINYALHTAKRFVPQTLSWSDLKRIQDAPLG